MKKTIEIRDEGIMTHEQKRRLVVLEFRVNDPGLAVWTYRAMDLQDLVSTIEGLQEDPLLEGLTWRIK